jgi:hypothetical protein
VPKSAYYGITASHNKAIFCLVTRYTLLCLWFIIKILLPPSTSPAFCYASLFQCNSPYFSSVIQPFCSHECW